MQWIFLNSHYVLWLTAIVSAICMVVDVEMDKVEYRKRVKIKCFDIIKDGQFIQ